MRFLALIIALAALFKDSYGLKGGMSQLSYEQRLRDAERLIDGREKSRASLNGRTLQEVYVQKHKSSSKKSKKSEAPSVSPSVSPMPSVSPAPSASPTISSAPSVSPSAKPSATPTISAAPSVAPSSTPSISPTLSSAPSGTPTASPTLSMVPSVSPTLSAAPTALGAQINTSTGPDGTVTYLAECTEPIPAAAIVEEQRVAFRYDLTLEAGKDLDEALNQVEERTNLRFANELMGDCTYTSGRVFETQGILSVPRDAPTGDSCGQDCYVIDGAVTLIIFYSSRRQLQVQTDLSSEEATELGPLLADVFDGDALAGNGVVGTRFGGLTNGPAEVSDTNDRGVTTDPGTAAITDETVGSQDSKVIASSVLVGAAVVALVAVIFVATRRRKNKKERVERMMLSDEMSEDDLELSADYGAPRTRGSSYEGYYNDEISLDQKARVLNDMSDYDAQSNGGSLFDVEGFSVNTTFVQPHFVPTARVPSDLESRRYKYRQRNYLASDTVNL